MPTSVHIPKPLLAAVDRRARRLRVSRNRVIVQALEKELARESEWSPGFFDELTRIDPDDAAVVDEMRRAIRAHRTSKKPPRL
jgi:ribbon-helix-helix CopG family protein